MDVYACLLAVCTRSQSRIPHPSIPNPSLSAAYITELQIEWNQALPNPIFFHLMRVDIVRTCLEIKVPKQPTNNQTHVQIRQTGRSQSAKATTSWIGQWHVLYPHAFPWSNREWCPNLPIVRFKLGVSEPSLGNELLWTTPISWGSVSSEKGH